MARVDGEDLDLEHVARLGALHVDGAGEDVPARAPVRHRVVDGPELRLDLAHREPHALESGGAVGEHGGDVDDGARRHPQHRRRGGVVVAEGHRGRRGAQAVHHRDLGGGGGGGHRRGHAGRDAEAGEGAAWADGGGASGSVHGGLGWRGGSKVGPRPRGRARAAAERTMGRGPCRCRVCRVGCASPASSRVSPRKEPGVPAARLLHLLDGVGGVTGRPAPSERGT